MYNDRTFPVHIISINICNHGVYICSCYYIELVCYPFHLIDRSHQRSSIASPPFLALALALAIQIPSSTTAKKGKREKGEKGKNLKNPPMGA